MRDCKEIKILLAICPSCHRGKDVLPQLEVSWNLILSHVSFLMDLFLLSQFPACLASCHCHCAGFSSRSSSTTGAFPKLGFCCAWPLGRAKVVSARLNPRNITIHVGGVCNFLSSVSPKQNLEAKGVTAQFYLAIKGKYILKGWGQADPKDTKRRSEKQGAQFWLLFLYVFFSSPRLRPLSLPYVNWASQKFASPEMFSVRKQFFFFKILSLIRMFTNLQNANIKVSSWLLKENVQLVKEGMRNEIAFDEGKWSSSDLQVAVSVWEKQRNGYRTG